MCGYIPDVSEFRAAFLGAITSLGQWWNWEKSYIPGDRRATRSAQVWRNALETFRIGEGCDRDCYEFAPNAGFIEWFPHDPYTDPNPDPVPAGYNTAPWYISSIDDPLWGTKTGDVATDITRFPPGSLPTIIPASGLPRFRLNLAGTGTVEIHMPNMFAGSIAQVTVDDDPLSAKFIDLTRDTLSAPPESGDVVIWEVEIDTPGQHYVDVIIVSKVNDDFPFLYHGGGLRKVVLCGFEEMFDEAIADWLEENLRFRFAVDCGLDVSVDAGETWDSVPGWDEFSLACFQGAQGEPGVPGEPGEPGAGVPEPPPTPTFNDPDELCGAASYIADKIIGIVSDTIDDLAVQTLQEVLESLLGGDGWEHSALFEFIGVLENQDTSTTKAEMQAGRDDLICALYCNELDKNEAQNWAAQYTSFGLVTKQAVSSAIEAASQTMWGTWAFVGGATVVDDCSGCGCLPWCYTWLDGNGLGTINVTYGTYNAGTDHIDTVTSGTGLSGEAHFESAVFAATDLTSIRVWARHDGSTNQATNFAKIFSGGVGGTEIHYQGVPEGISGLVLYEWAGIQSFTQFAFIIGMNNPAGGEWIEKIEVRGVGVNPFGANNC